MVDLLNASRVKAPKHAPQTFPVYREKRMQQVAKKVRKIIDKSGLHKKPISGAVLNYLSDRLPEALSTKGRSIRPSHIRTTLSVFSGRTLDSEMIDYLSNYLAANQAELHDRPVPPARTGNPGSVVLCRIEGVEPQESQWVFTARILSGRWYNQTFKFSMGRVGVSRLGWRLGATGQRDNPLHPSDVIGMLAWGTFNPQETDELRLKRLDGRPSTYVMNHNREHYKEKQQRRRRILRNSTLKEKENACIE